MLIFNFYSAASSPLGNSKSFSFHTHPSSPGRHFHFQLTPLGGILARQQLRSKGTRLITHISTTVYSQEQVLIYTAEFTGASWRERKRPNFETGKWDSNQGSLDCESGILPLSSPLLPQWFVSAQLKLIVD